ncbi:MAG: hypothetical protein AAF840_02940 [Bacteroidota bacterium]
MDAPTALVEGVLIGVGLSFVLFEVALNLNDVEGDTTNIVLEEWSYGKFFFIPFALAAIAGHLFLGTTTSFFPDKSIEFDGLFGVLALFGISGLMLLIGWLVPFRKTKFLITTLVVLGLAFGHFFWSMNIIK